MPLMIPALPARTRFYVASRLENATEVRRVQADLAALGHACTYDWTTHGPVWADGLVRLREVASAELAGVRQANYVVVLLPGGRGTHTELGAALAYGRRIYVCSQAPAVDFGAVEGTCAFYHYPQVWKGRPEALLPAVLDDFPARDTSYATGEG